MTGTVDVADVIDSHKVSRYQCLIAWDAADDFIRLAVPFLKS